MKKFVIISIIFVLAVLSAVLSIKYERNHPTVIGNVCQTSPENPKGLCYENLPAAGFPFSYLYDQGGVSVMGTLDIAEDNFYFTWFIADIILYFISYLIILFLIIKIYKFRF